MRRLYTLIAVIGFACLSAPAQASKADHKDLAFDPVVFAQQRQALEREISTGERYRSIAPADRRQVMDALQRMQANLDGKASLSQLNEKERLAVFNDQELINSLLTQAAADSRLICTSETPVGTRLPKRTCKTVGERRLEREAARDTLQQGGARVPVRQGDS